MVGQVGAELAGAVASRHKVKRLAGSRVQGRGQSPLARHGDGCGRQAFAGVGVPGVVGLQIDTAQITVKPLEHAVDDRGVGLQGHVDAQAVDEHAGNHGAVADAACFFLDDAGQHQGLVGVFQGQAHVTLSPRQAELAIHGLGRALQDMQVRAALAHHVGVWVKTTFGGHAGFAEVAHEFLVVQGGRVVFQKRRLVHGLAELSPCPTFHQGDAAQGFVTAHQFLQQVPGRGVAADFIAARSNLLGLAAELEQVVEGGGGLVDACLHSGLGDGLDRLAGFDGQIDRGLAQRQGLQHPPSGPSRSHQQGQQASHEGQLHLAPKP